METAAGARMANVVVDDDGVGQSCIEYLKGNNLGRATFLPLNKMDERSLSSSPLGHDGVIDYAFNLVDFSDKYRGVFSYVFGDTLVVEDIDTARDLMGRNRMVTLDGDLVEKSGAMTGGTTRNYSYSFGSKGLVERLADEIQELESRRSDVKDELGGIVDRLDDLETKIRDKRGDLDSIKDRKEDLEEMIETLQNKMEVKQESLEDLRNLKQDTKNEMEEVEEEITDLNEEIEDLEQKAEKLKQEMNDSRLQELTDERDELKEEINQLNSDLQEVDGKLNDKKRKKNYKEKRLGDLEEKIQDIDETKQDKRDKIEELEEEIDELQDKIEEREEEVAEIEDDISELKEEKEELGEELEEAKQKRDSINHDIDDVREEINALRRKVKELDQEAEELREDIPDDHDEVPDLDEVEAEIERIESEMEELKPVNMKAIDKFEAVDDEIKDLEERKATLDEEKKGILKRIDEFEELKHETFMEAFEEIDSHFRDIFSRLSEGSGELVLENEEDPFESGLTIKANPGDKPVKRLQGLSGGERSLTALSLIFAVQRYTPAPFYAFDEVDMFLDAPNAERVAEMIDELSDDAQFVVVSLRTPMIERSERTIGVTMQRDNISKITGVEFDDSGGESTGHAEAD